MRVVLAMRLLDRNHRDKRLCYHRGPKDLGSGVLFAIIITREEDCFIDFAFCIPEMMFSHIRVKI